MQTPLILVTNDDGVYAPGLRALHEAVSSLGEAVIVAPERDNSAVSHSLTMNRPLRVVQLDAHIHMIDGTPTDCVTIAINKILHRKPDLLVSGINPGANLGDDISYWERYRRQLKAPCTTSLHSPFRWPANHPMILK